MSGRSLDVARARFGDLADFTHFDGATLPFAPHRFDVAFSACVFHHISAAEHVPVLAEMRRTLREHGTVAIFEHNPINPLTVYTVKTCPFDENARLIGAGTMLRRMAEAGFSALERRFCFPAFLRRLRRFEPQLSWCPAGAQYCIRPLLALLNGSMLLCAGRLREYVVRLSVIMAAAWLLQLGDVAANAIGYGCGLC